MMKMTKEFHAQNLVQAIYMLVSRAFLVETKSGHVFLRAKSCHVFWNKIQTNLEQKPGFVNNKNQKRITS
jgi:hypothetical protein